MIAAVLALAMLLYAWGVVRAARRRIRLPSASLGSFALGLVTVALALLGPLDTLADGSLAFHMVQHLALVGLAAPLLVLGAPVRVTLAALPHRAATAVAAFFGSGVMRVLMHPAVAWLQFAAVLYGTHFSPMYEGALEHPALHAAEHALYLTSALIFWTPLFAVAPSRHAPDHPTRLLMVFLAIPMSAFLGFAFYVTHHVLYAHYAATPGALDDQMNAGAVMWLAGATPLFVTLLWLVADWGARERRAGAL